MESNDVLDKLPHHLHTLIIDQPYDNYTAQDHAVWRYIMNQNIRYLPDVAHSSYLEGLKRTGISINHIPKMYGMNRILKEIGWAAVAVDGFIPPAAFMEFQAYNVLVIAADIRPIDQILYTPAPDIIHEAAGHAPIIADPEYAAYLRYFGQVGTKAFSSSFDTKIYEAIRHLSILKADPYTPFEAIEKAEAELDFLSSQQESPSEMALLRNLHWWTVEYGLIGKISNPKIYGAGLLSSIGESCNCLKPQIKKLPYTIEAQNFAFDITNQQPQLFVTPDFNHLTAVLDQYLKTMAVSKGGLTGLKKAVKSDAVATAVFSSGLQVSGKLTKVYDSEKEPVYLVFEGKSMLAVDNKQVSGHGTDYHKDGFGSPVGKIKGISGRLETMSEGELEANGINTGLITELHFESGIQVKGVLKRIVTYKGSNLILSFDNCRVEYNGIELFNPNWGIYDMAIGETIRSVFAGPADPYSFGLKYPAPIEKTHHLQHTPESKQLHQLYEKVAFIRKNGSDYAVLDEIWQTLKHNYPNDWLLPLEILEMPSENHSTYSTKNEITDMLKARSKENEELQKLIEDGLLVVTTSKSFGSQKQQ